MLSPMSLDSKIMFKQIIYFGLFLSLYFPYVAFYKLTDSENQPFVIIWLFIVIFLKWSSVGLNLQTLTFIYIFTLSSCLFLLIFNTDTTYVFKVAYINILAVSAIIFVNILSRSDELIRLLRQTYDLALKLTIVVCLGQYFRFLPLDMPFVTRDFAFSDDWYFSSGRGVIGFGTEAHTLIEPMFGGLALLSILGCFTSSAFNVRFLSILMIVFLSRSAVWAALVLPCVLTLVVNSGKIEQSKHFAFLVFMITSSFALYFLGVFDNLGRIQELVIQLVQYTSLKDLYSVFGNSLEFRYMPVLGFLHLQCEFNCKIFSPFTGDFYGYGFPGLSGITSILSNILFIPIFFYVILLSLYRLPNLYGKKGLSLMLTLPLLSLTALSSVWIWLVIGTLLVQRKKKVKK